MTREVVHLDNYWKKNLYSYDSSIRHCVETGNELGLAYAKEDMASEISRFDVDGWEWAYGQFPYMREKIGRLVKHYYGEAAYSRWRPVVDDGQPFWETLERRSIVEHELAVSGR